MLSELSGWPQPHKAQRSRPCWGEWSPTLDSVHSCPLQCPEGRTRVMTPPFRGLLLGGLSTGTSWDLLSPPSHQGPRLRHLCPWLRVLWGGIKAFFPIPALRPPFPLGPEFIKSQGPFLQAPLQKAASLQKAAPPQKAASLPWATCHGTWGHAVLWEDGSLQSWKSLLCLLSAQSREGNKGSVVNFQSGLPHPHQAAEHQYSIML